MITYRQLHQADVEHYKQIRLQMLKEEPIYFGSSFEEESQFNESQWIARLAKTTTIAMAAFDQDVIVGLAFGMMNPRAKMKHKASINSMYVKPKYRKQGIGSQIILRILDECKKHHVSYIQLSVAKTNLGAYHLYESIGFTTYGIEPCGIYYNNTCIDLIHMQKEI